jgi:putative membrane protein
MNHHLATGFVVAIACIASGASALAQQDVSTSPIPANPTPAESRPNQELHGGPGGVTPTQQRRLNSTGSPQDTGARAAADQVNPSSDGAAYIAQTLAAGTVTRQGSEFARSKAADSRVKSFAEQEIAEQTALADALHALSDPSATASTGAGQAASTGPVLSQQASAAMQRLSHESAGPNFDRDYVASQIGWHQDLIAVQEQFLNTNPSDDRLRELALRTRDTARRHLSELQDMQTGGSR